VEILKFEPNSQPMKNDIATLKDIQFLVDQFYAVVQKDPFLGPIFNPRLAGRWEMHHRKLYRFWHTVLLRRPDYFGDPVPMHFDLNIGQRHFDEWLRIWTEIVDANFEGMIAERAKFRGKTIGKAFLAKIKKNLEI
jgi:hemoglobin